MRQGAHPLDDTQDEARAALVDAMGQGQRGRSRQNALRVRLHQRRCGRTQRGAARECAGAAASLARTTSRRDRPARLSPPATASSSPAPTRSRASINGTAGTITGIDGTKITVQLDGSDGDMHHLRRRRRSDDFRHGYAGTIYRGQGRTLDQTYLYHSEHWRSAASYVALTRHRDKGAVRGPQHGGDVKELARQMGRRDDRRAASMFYARGLYRPGPPASPRARPLSNLPRVGAARGTAARASSAPPRGHAGRSAEATRSAGSAPAPKYAATITRAPTVAAGGNGSNKRTTAT